MYLHQKYKIFFFISIRLIFTTVILVRIKYSFTFLRTLYTTIYNEKYQTIHYNSVSFVLISKK